MMRMMKKLAILVLLVLPAGVAVCAQQSIHVLPGAPKGGKGTLQAPYSSIEDAQKAVRKLNRKMNGDITVYLHGGTYDLRTPLLFTEEDSGRNGFRVIYKAYENETPVISGGQIVTGWEPTMHRHIYSAPFRSDRKLRTLFVNGERARMAGMETPVMAQGSWGEMKVEGNEPWAFGEGTVIKGVKFMYKDLPLLRNAEDVELIQSKIWCEKILCASEIGRIDRDTVAVTLQQPYGAILTSLAWAGRMEYDQGFILRNAFEFLDKPGEFYFDRKQQRIYYYTEDTNMATANVVAPVCEGLIRIYGSSNDSRVKNLVFEGLTFSHDAWELMKVGESYGFGGIQSLGLATKYIPDGNWHPTKYNSIDVPAGSVDVKNSENIAFTRNRFVQLSSGTGISYVNDVTGSEIAGNFFNDLLGNAITIGHPQHYEIGDGDIYPSGIEGVCKNIRVTDNYIRNVSLDFRMAEAILAFFVNSVNFDHNDILGMPYGGIAVGWWWANAGIPPSAVPGRNTINYNRIGQTHRVLTDGGMIYTLGEQPDSEIVGNYLFDGPRGIYPDDGSAYFAIKNNFVNSLFNHWLHIASDRCHDMVIDSNYVKTNNMINEGVRSTVTNTVNYRNRPFDEKALAIMENAGIREHCKDIIPTEEPDKIEVHPWVRKESLY